MLCDASVMQDTVRIALRERTGLKAGQKLFVAHAELLQLMRTFNVHVDTTKYIISIITFDEFLRVPLLLKVRALKT